MANDELDKILKNQEKYREQEAEREEKAREEAKKDQKTFLGKMFGMFKKASDNTKSDRKKATDEVGKQVTEVIGDEMSKTASAISGIIKGDMDKVVGEVGSQAADVLGPEITKVASVATGTLRSAAGIGKALFGKSEEDEEESKSDEKRNTMLEDMVDHFKSVEKRWGLVKEDSKKTGVMGNIMMVGAILVGVIVGYTTSLVKVFKPLFRAITGIAGKMGKIGKTFGKMGKIGKMFRKLGNSFKLGGLLGKILLPIEMIGKALKGIFDGETIRDKILGMSAGLLDPILQLPEMIGNGILWLARKVFGEDFLGGFEFDFGMDAIIGLVDRATAWSEKWIHKALDGFFLIKEKLEKFSFLNLITTAADNLINFFKNLIPGKEMFGKLKGFFKFGGKKEEGTEVPGAAIGGDIIKSGLLSIHKGERVLPAEIVDLPSSVKKGSNFGEINNMKRAAMQSNTVESKNAADVNRKLQEKQLKAIEKTESTTNNGNVSVINALTGMKGGGERPIPDEVDNIITSLAVQGAY